MEKSKKRAVEKSKKCILGKVIQMWLCNMHPFREAICGFIWKQIQPGWPEGMQLPQPQSSILSTISLHSISGLSGFVWKEQRPILLHYRSQCLLLISFGCKHCQSYPEHLINLNLEIFPHQTQGFFWNTTYLVFFLKHNIYRGNYQWKRELLFI